MSSLRKKKNQSGFTLIELLIVVIIVAVLAAVGIPLLQGNVARARLTEADAGLGTIRTGMRSYYAEHASYQNGTTAPTFTSIGITDPTGTGTTRTPGDLDGRFFSTEVYSVSTTDNTHFCGSVDGTNTGNVAAKKADVSTVNRSMNQDGDIFNSKDCSGTRIN